MNLPPGVSLLEIMDTATNGHSADFCLKCGKKRNGFTKPDANSNYPCENCGSILIFGAKQIIFLNIR